MIKYKMFGQFYIEGGIMAGLGYKAFDEFKNKVVDKEDLTYKLKVSKFYHPIDLGGIAGIVYRFQKGKGMNLAVRYYYGFVDISNDDSTPNQFNSSLYVSMCIPIGAGKAKAKAEAKEGDKKVKDKK
jgi:hypothetical protein